MTKKINLMSSQKLLSLLLLLVLTFICGCSNESNNISISDTSENNDFESTSINLTAVGDVMAHSPQLKAQYNSQNNTYSFDNNFKYIK
ncbi:MAG: CapA family protein, partial [Romboutsia sp.]|nr:CapA family protein [Romboutsia sp.]